MLIITGAKELTIDFRADEQSIPIPTLPLGVRIGFRSYYVHSMLKIREFSYTTPDPISPFFNDATPHRLVS